MITYYLSDASTGGSATPSLMRRVNYGDERLIGVGIDNVQLTWDLVDGATNPSNVETPVSPNTPHQVRKANLHMAARDHRPTVESSAHVGPDDAGQPALTRIRGPLPVRQHMSRPAARHLGSERGVALVAALLLLILMSAMLAGFMTLVVSDSRLRAGDRSRTQAFYAAHAGLEKLTADLGNLFVTDFSPEAADLIDLQNDAAGDRELRVHCDRTASATPWDSRPAADGNPLICRLGISNPVRIKG